MFPAAPITRTRFWSSVALSLLLAAAGCRKPDAAPAAKRPGGATGRVQPVEVTTVVRRDLVESLTVVGSVAPNESADMRAEIAGLVRGIYFEEGQTIRRGDVLVKIDDAELRAQLAQAEARFQLATLNLERSENLRKTQSTTQADYDRARTEFASSKADLSVLRLRLEKTEVKAPFDGVVGARSLSPGDYVTNQTPITTIDDLSRLKIEFQMPERYLFKVQPGTRIAVSSRSLGTDQVVQGEVYFVSSVIDRATRSSTVKGLLSNPPPSLKPGMFANIEVVLEVRSGVLTVPEGAILTTAVGSSVIVARGTGPERTAEFVRVNLGLRSRGLVEVTPTGAALDEKSEVVASGVGGLILFPGAKLLPRPLKAEFRVGE
ncbi:MAG: efflux RND transporter periplasmic adaptor subunit [Verrucomicrobia bacterium]|nr:efflux RND transporter periplasmic adaptor subunit [Verrucomicrobiota bacterium]